MIAIDLSKQQALDVDTKAIQQINFIGNLARDEDANITKFFIIEEDKKNYFRFFTNNCETIIILFCLIFVYFSVISV